MNAITRDREGVAALIAAYESTTTPAEAARAFLGACDNAAEIMARLVNRYAWDGRISDRAKRWAEGITTEEAAIGTDRIHRAHLNQIAEEMIRL